MFIPIEQVSSLPGIRHSHLWSKAVAAARQAEFLSFPNFYCCLSRVQRRLNCGITCILLLQLVLSVDTAHVNFRGPRSTSRDPLRATRILVHACCLLTGIAKASFACL
ncbi:hypothetical protein ARMSODRAFT_444714 [Armillaria solidipes]|uniref:Uncharacterized protein n=1 Tax=Armillaria solidipes TaxID=1076256 RepID=A0A2H3BPZ9_9AGAR|nr:hypothetical protein ARMSODRAFT_444714 [Armillaria solidipes]